MIEFAVAEHVRARFPERKDRQFRRRLTDAVAAASAIAEAAIVEEAEAEGTHAALACRAGCSFCCHMRVVATVPEIIAVHDAVIARRSASEIAALTERLAAVDRLGHGLSDEEWGENRIPCPMLADGLCSVYGSRPLDCRAYNSTAVDACENAFDDYLEWEVPQDHRVMSVNKSAQAGLLQGLAGAGLPPRLVEFAAALRIAFENPTAIERWQAGEGSFAEAELALSDPEQRAFLPWLPSDELREIDEER